MSVPYMTAERLRALDAQLSDRDRAVLRRVAELRFVSGGQLGRMDFPDVPRRTVREALLRLKRLDVLERLPRSVGGVRAGSPAYVYRLSSAGQRLAALHGWLPSASRWRAHVPGTLFVAHALKAAELHALLVEADRAGRIELIELAGEAASRRRYGGPLGPRVLKPDSFARVGSGEYELVFFIEIDMGTEGSRALTTKLRQYADYEASGQEQAERGVFPLTLWLAPDAERVGVIADCIRLLPRPARSLFRVAPFTEVEAVIANPGAGGGLPNNEKMEARKGER
jgi:Replication-relaxation